MLPLDTEGGIFFIELLKVIYIIFFPYDLFQEADMRKSHLKTKSKFHISQLVLVSRHICLALSFERIVLFEDEKSRVF